jgi:hypothetical protein
MSVQLLSSRDRDTGTSSEPAQHELAPGTFDNSKADEIIAKAIEANPGFDGDQDQSNEKRGLDNILRDATAKYEAKQTEEKAFEASKPDRLELNARYGSQGDLSQTLDRFIDMARRFKQDPVATASEFIESYAKASPYSLNDKRTGRMPRSRLMPKPSWRRWIQRSPKPSSTRSCTTPTLSGSRSATLSSGHSATETLHT